MADSANSMHGAQADAAGARIRTLATNLAVVGLDSALVCAETGGLGRGTAEAARRLAALAARMERAAWPLGVPQRADQAGDGWQAALEVAEEASAVAGRLLAAAVTARRAADGEGEAEASSAPVGATPRAVAAGRRLEARSGDARRIAAWLRANKVR
ncbi:hypothetical protein Ga0061061_10445 [Chelatococcus sambhunathii]|uniref:Phasin protein n=2 Tax=Chelatococcus sambhunathii TaxID=363953 RepID=A0ABP2A5K7_9HYPH|nr:hypothetical protein Ga0061061_10445 [Chelatococcus sambhunathii]